MLVYSTSFLHNIALLFQAFDDLIPRLISFPLFLSMLSPKDDFDPPVYNRHRTSSSSSTVQTQQRASMSEFRHVPSSSENVTDKLRNFTMALSNARSSWPMPSTSTGPNASTTVITLATQQAQDEEDALSGATLRISIDSASESAKSLKDMAAKYGMYPR